MEFNTFNEFYRAHQKKDMKNEIHIVKNILKDKGIVYIKEIEKEINEKYIFDFSPYYYSYNGIDKKATIKGTIKKALEFLLEDGLVLQSKDGRYALKEILDIQDSGKIVYKNEFLYKQFQKEGLVNNIVSDDEILQNCGYRPVLEDVGLNSSIHRVTQEELESANLIIKNHNYSKPWIFGRSQWESEHKNLEKKYKDLLSEYNRYREQFEYFDKLLKDYENKVATYTLNKINLGLEEIKKTEQFWYNLKPLQFEDEIANLFNKLGFKATRTKGSGDGGVDIILEAFGGLIAIQCKAHKDLIGPNIVRELAGVISRDGYIGGMIVALKGFTSGAIRESKPLRVSLVDVYTIIKWANIANNSKNKEKLNNLFVDLSSNDSDSTRQKSSEKMSDNSTKNQFQHAKDSKTIRDKFLANVNKINWKKVVSGNIDCIAYNEETARLFVKFKTSPAIVYYYDDVTVPEYNSLLYSESKGKHLNSFIIPSHICHSINIQN